MSKHLLPFLCALVACPAFILLHECGHYVAGSCLGLSPTLHAGEVQPNPAKEKITQHAEILFTSGGPLMGAVLAVVGFLWLRRLRVHRREAASNSCDWLATSLVLLNVGRGFQALAGTPSHPRPSDEAFLSRALGLPAYLFPYSFGLLAVIALVGTVRLHPPGGRLLPFLSMLLGSVIGALLWLELVGPFLLP